MDYMKNYGSENPGELNQFAWKMFEASENPAQLAAAESWAKKALELSGGDYMIHDTYASLLFKNKKYALAREEAGKAIQSGKKDGQDVSGTEDLLAKISHEINKPTTKAKPKPGSKSKKK
jgi:predicted Zn-dependent protease